MTSGRGSLERFVPRVASEWDLDVPGARWRRIDGTLCFVDISGFTNLSEKLARRGRVGAEELTEVLDRVFGNMLRLAYARGGSLLKFGGDALLLMFEGDDHPVQGASAAVEMRAALRKATEIPTSVGVIRLKMSVGLHTGLIDLFLVGDSHRELVVTGATATTTTEMEAAADAGEILVSPDLGSRLPRGAAGALKGPGVLLRWRKAPVEPVGPLFRQPVDPSVLAGCVPTVLRSHLDHGVAEPEHRVATVGFIKFKGVDAAMAAGGHDLVASGLEELITAVQAAVDPEGVTFLATDIDADGGKVILTTGVPGAQEDDEGRMLRAVRRIAEAGTSFPLKIGVNRGHVFAGEIGTEFRSTYTVMGDTVNLAARLMAAAPAGSVYAAPSVLDRSRTLFATEALEPFYVKGKSEPVQAYAVGAETGSRTTPTHRELPFTGRDGELATLRKAIDALDGGTGGAITVTGDTGFGKSRLVVEALTATSPATFTVRAEPYGATNPYWAFRDPLRSLLGIERGGQAEMSAALAEKVTSLDPRLVSYLPLIGDAAHIDVPDTPETAAIEPRFRPDRTAATLVGLLEVALPGPLVIVVEDGHWIDEASASLVTMLASVAAPPRPWLVVLTTRPGGDHLTDPLGSEIPLGPLADEAARSIAIAVTEAAPLRPHELETVVSRAAGNPLFLEEILRLVRTTGSVDDLPDSLDAVVGAEIDTLRPLTRRLLRYSSVLGRSFRRVVLDELLAPENVVLDAATRRELARFVEPEGTERWRFRHSVMHDVAYQGLSYRKRKELHARAGEVIEQLAGADTDSVAEFLALHYAEAGEHEKAWRYGVIAGDRAKAAFANVEAAQHYRRALGQARHLHDSANRSVPKVAESLGDVLEQAGMFEEALAAFGRAAQRIDDPAVKARIMMKRARAHVRIGSYPAAVRQTTLGTKLVESVESPDASIALSQLVALASGIRLQQGRPGLALPLAEQARELAQANGDRDALARAYTVLDGALEMLGRPEEAVYADRARAIYEELGDTPGVATVDNNVGVRAYDEGRWDDAVAAYTQAQEGFRLSGNLPQAALCGANIGEVLVSQGRLDQAAPILREAVRTLRTADFADLAIFAEIQLARLDLARGHLTEACDDLEQLREEAEANGQIDTALEAALHHADALISLGSPGRALDLLDEAEAGAGEDAAIYEAGLLRVRARAALQLGRDDEAISLVSRGLTVATEQGLVYEEALMRRVRAEALRDDGRNDLEEANRLLQVLGVVA
jgi:class 3 adenylate cyclase/tetratricopeptide (TPR) repeat protein